MRVSFFAVFALAVTACEPTPVARYATVALTIDGVSQPPLKVYPGNPAPLDAYLPKLSEEWSSVVATSEARGRMVAWERAAAPSRTIMLGYAPEGPFLGRTQPGHSTLDAPLTLNRVQQIDVRTETSTKRPLSLEIRVEGEGRKTLDVDALSAIQKVRLEAPNRKRLVEAWQVVDILGSALSPQSTVEFLGESGTYQVSAEALRSRSPQLVIKPSRGPSLALIEVDGAQRTPRLKNLWGLRVGKSSTANERSKKHL